MAGLVGGIFTTVGIVQIYDMLARADSFFGKKVEQVKNDTKCKQITRIVARALFFAGLFALAIASFSIGSVLLTTGLQVGLVLGFEAAVMSSLPSLIFGIGAMTTAKIARQLSKY